MQLRSSGFMFAMVMLVGLISFATVSIDGSTVEKMSVVGDFTDPQLASIRKTLGDVNFAASELGRVKQSLGELEWVHHVNVRKTWPAAIVVEVHAQKVIAYWNDNGFINEEGVVLYTDLLIGGDLPHLYGPDGAELDVMAQYQQLSQMLNSYGHEINVLKVTDRGSWSLETEEGVEVLLGKENLKARMQRFLTVSSRLATGGDERVVERMDARYINGVAVHFEDDKELKIAELNNSVGERSL